MRTALVMLPLLIAAAPAAAQAPAPVAPPPQDIQRALHDPAMADRLANVMQALSKAFLDLPVGEVQAAVEGRAPTSAEKRMTVRDVERRTDPNFERNFRQQVANARPMIQQSMKALSDALPAMMQGLQQAGQALDRAAANMPDPTYPKK